MRGIHQWLVDSPHKGPITWKMFPFHDVIMILNHPDDARGSTHIRNVPRNNEDLLTWSLLKQLPMRNRVSRQIYAMALVVLYREWILSICRNCIMLIVCYVCQWTQQLWTFPDTYRLSHSLLAQPLRQAFVCLKGCARRVSVAFEKQQEFLPTKWANNTLQLTHNSVQVRSPPLYNWIRKTYTTN